MARGRKVNSNGERSKQLLLEKAIELFATHGYHETKISDIVKASNLTQPTFYLYFKSKDSMFMDLNEEFKQNVLTIFNEDIELFESKQIVAHEYISGRILKALTYFYENPNLTKIGLFEAQTADEVKDQIVQKVMKILHNDAKTLQLHTQFEIEMFANSIVGSIERLTYKYILTNEQSPETMTNAIINMYFKQALVTTV